MTTRRESLVKAKTWMERNHITGTASCNHVLEWHCDVIPYDSRPPGILNCYDECVLLEH